MTERPQKETQLAVDLVTAYLETGWAALDAGNLDIVRASFRRMAQHLLALERWDAINGSDDS